MICGARTFIPELGQHRFCTFPIGLHTNPNHDMPDQNNQVKPHRSGEWTWSSRYDIGPEQDWDWVDLKIQTHCRKCATPIEEYQRDNVLWIFPTDTDLNTGCFYRCPGCDTKWSTLEHRKEYQT